MCATIARRLVRCNAAVHPEEAFLAGLLHDIGKLLLWANFRSDYTAILQAVDSGAERLLAGEAQLGATHCEVGAWTIRQWGLDSLMADAVYYHHEDFGRIVDALPLGSVWWGTAPRKTARRSACTARFSRSPPRRGC